MKELIDLYAKMIIGTFTFIGPSFTLLSSLCFEHIDRVREKYQERLIGLAAVSNGKHSPIRKLLSEAERAENLLTPKRQVIRLFGSLLLSLVLIAFYYFQHTQYCNFENTYLKASTIGLSIVFYVYALVSLWQVFCVIFNSKEEEQKERRIKKEHEQRINEGIVITNPTK